MDVFIKIENIQVGDVFLKSGKTITAIERTADQGGRFLTMRDVDGRLTYGVYRDDLVVHIQRG